MVLRTNKSIIAFYFPKKELMKGRMYAIPAGKVNFRTLRVLRKDLFLTGRVAINPLPHLHLKQYARIQRNLFSGN
jgi:hypothetical protein